MGNYFLKTLLLYKWAEADQPQVTFTPEIWDKTLVRLDSKTFMVHPTLTSKTFTSKVKTLDQVQLRSSLQDQLLDQLLLQMKVNATPTSKTFMEALTLISNSNGFTTSIVKLRTQLLAQLPHQLLDQLRPQLLDQLPHQMRVRSTLTSNSSTSTNITTEMVTWMALPL